MQKIFQNISLQVRNAEWDLYETFSLALWFGPTTYNLSVVSKEAGNSQVPNGNEWEQWSTERRSGT